MVLLMSMFTPICPTAGYSAGLQRLLKGLRSAACQMRQRVWGPRAGIACHAAQGGNSAAVGHCVERTAHRSISEATSDGLGGPGVLGHVLGACTHILQQVPPDAPEQLTMCTQAYCLHDGSAGLNDLATGH